VNDSTITILEWTPLPQREQQYVNFTVEGDNPSRPVIRPYFQDFLRKYALLSDGHGQHSSSDYAFTRSGPQLMSARTPRTVEFKIEGVRPREGWLMARWPGGEWGYVASSGRTDDYRSQQFALFVCNNTGNYVANRIAHYTFGEQSPSPRSARNVPNASDNWSSASYTSLYDFACTLPATADADVSGNVAFAKHCQYMANAVAKPYITLGNNAMYFQCAVQQYRFRLKGAFKGAGISEYFDPNTKQWLGFAASNNAAVVQTICTKFMQLAPVANFTPTVLGIAEYPSRPVNLFDGVCDRRERTDRHVLLQVA
jgi:hypothetical protein